MRLRDLRTIDWSLFIVPVFLVAFGVTILLSFSFGGRNLAISQLVFAAIGLVAMGFLTLLDYRVLRGTSWLLYLLTLGLLVLVVFVGSRIFGAQRWLDLGVFQLQPSELMKLVLMLVVARLLTSTKSLSWRILIAFIVLVGLPLGLILQQPDLGTASVILVVTATMLAHAKTPRVFWALVVIATLVAAPLLWSQFKPYQRDRIYTFLYPSRDPTGVGYNVAQAKIAIGSGGIWGRGLGQGSQSQLNFLPVAHTDFIFAAIAEATGFIGSSVLLSAYTILVWRALSIATQAQDDYGQYVALGIATMFLFQATVNIGMNVGLLPVTGISLPFVSFGGSGMITNFAAIGILQSIYIRHKKIRFG